MFAARTIRPTVAVARTQAVQQQQAGMATLKEIDQRLKSVKNIGKITKVGGSMCCARRCEDEGLGRAAAHVHTELCRVTAA